MLDLTTYERAAIIGLLEAELLDIESTDPATVAILRSALAKLAA
jgi:hypothetical protein